MVYMLVKTQALKYIYFTGPSDKMSDDLENK
jgi:hypothetical protein